MDTFLIFLLGFSFGAAKIRINNLDVPSAIESGSVDEVILDCDFESNGESGIEVKWYYSGQIAQIYQWIPETQKVGQALGLLKDNIDVNYRATDDINTMYRALRITNVSPDISGNYTCKVSGDDSEDMKTKSMIIYDTAEDGIELGLYESDSVVYCKAGGLYPEPDMRIYISKDNESNIIFEEDEETLDFDEFDESYNVSSTLYFTPENLTGTFFYACELGIPGTPYRLFEIKAHSLEESGEVDSSVETQIEDDYVNLLNSTNSTESFVEDLQWQEFETQIEEALENDLNATSVESSTVGSDQDIKKSDESAAFRHLPDQLLIIIVLLTATCILNRML